MSSSGRRPPSGKLPSRRPSKCIDRQRNTPINSQNAQLSLDNPPPAQARTEITRESAIARFAPALLAWFDCSGRKHLPWQQDTTPYRVWVSEIMLQQTQVTTVIPYYTRFMARFPDVRALAEAPIDTVLHLWTGLGYYARARNLHRAAQMIVTEHAGEFPDTLDAVQALPGIGRSTAGAILSLSRSQRHPILDGNVKRVLTRCFGIAGFPGQQHVERELWTIAEACTPQERVGNHTQAIMDLGATLCVRSRPLCPTCPLGEFCVARRDNLQSALPTPKPKKARPQRTAYAVLALRGDGAVLLERRPPAGIWGGLWTFPQFEDRDAALAWMQTQKIDREASEAEPASGSQPNRLHLEPYSHSFTHFELTLHPIVVRLAQPQSFVADVDKQCWYDPRHPAQIGLAKPSVDLIRRLMDISSVISASPPP